MTFHRTRLRHVLNLGGTEESRQPGSVIYGMIGRQDNLAKPIIQVTPNTDLLLRALECVLVPFALLYQWFVDLLGPLGDFLSNDAKHTTIRVSLCSTPFNLALSTLLIVLQHN